MPPGGVIAVDVGNSRVKFFHSRDGHLRQLVVPADADALDLAFGRVPGPAVERTETVGDAAHCDRDTAVGRPDGRGQLDRHVSQVDGGDLSSWLAAAGTNPIDWWVSSVSPATSARLEELIRRARPQDRWYPIVSTQVPILDQLENRAATGVDRLLAAWFASRYLSGLAPDAAGAHPTGMIVVDAGSAVTVDWVDSGGIFRGGMIYPGWALAASALSRGTAALPDVATRSESSPDATANIRPLGRETQSAMIAGLYWSQWGGLCAAVEALQQYASQQTGQESGVRLLESHALSRSGPVPSVVPSVVVTGGGIETFVDRLPKSWRWEPLLMARAILQFAQDADRSPPTPQP
jgi:pantothenate kinase type III